MDKEIFNEYEGMLFCESCNKYVPKIHMNHRRVKQGFKISKCNVDMYLDRHKELFECKEYTLAELKVALHCFLYQEVSFINDLAEELNKSIAYSIDLYKYLNMKNKHVRVRSKCNHCGKEIEINVAQYLNLDNNYCSRKCYILSKKENMKGELNTNYKRIKTDCTFCGKEILIIPYRYNTINSFGDNHNFCSKECYLKSRSVIKYSRKRTQEQKKNILEGTLNGFSKRGRLNTSPQLILDDILKEKCITFEREKPFDFYAVDNYLPDYNCVIEVMGDYWHSNPLKYNINHKINAIQQKQLNRDKIKHTYIQNHYHCLILYLWETDLKKRKKVCSKLIDKFLDSIINNYTLESYQSFNWEETNDIRIRDSIILPYQEQDIENYRNIFLLQNA